MHSDYLLACKYSRLTRVCVCVCVCVWNVDAVEYVRPAEASVLALQKFWGQVMYLDLSKVE